MAEMEIYELEDGGVYKENNDEFTQQLKFTFTPLKGWNIYADIIILVIAEDIIFLVLKLSLY